MVEVRFEQEMYTVNEMDGEVEVCLHVEFPDGVSSVHAVEEFVIDVFATEKDPVEAEGKYEVTNL